MNKASSALANSGQRRPNALFTPMCVSEARLMKISHGHKINVFTL